MKKYLKFLMLLPFAALLAACDLGDSEPVGKYAFETDAQKILIEAKLPAGTYDSDEIYICGPFNGAEEESYVADAKWQLTQSSVNINIFGVYLDPATFVEGTSLADGFWLYSKNSGCSLTTKKELATYTSNADRGQRTSIVVSQWGEPVKDVVETLPEHDGYRVYVQDKAEWGAMALYAWGDAEFFGGWPGAQPTGTEIISEVEYTYFEFKDAEGLTLNLIINNNNGGTQTADINITFGDQKDFFYAVTGTGKPCTHEVIENPIKTVVKMPEHDNSIRVYVDNQAGWEGVKLYMYGTVNHLGGEWPGAEATGTETIGDVEYVYFEYAIADVEGNEEHLIFNDGNGTRIPGAQEPVITFSADVVDYAFLINADLTCVAIDPTDRSADEAPETPETPETPEDPETPEEPETPAEPVPVYFYIQDNTGWEVTNIYAWSSGLPEIFGGWPGAALETEVTCGGVAYNRVETTATAYELVYHPIFNNGSDQYDAPVVTLAKYNFLIAGETAATLGEAPATRIYVADQTGWDAIALYCWGDSEVFGGWPGAQVAGTETIDGVEYKYFDVPAAAFGKKVNLIFNNNNGGTQIENKAAQKDLVLDQDYFYVVTADDAVFVE